MSDLNDPRAVLSRIVARELAKLETWASTEALLSEPHLKALEVLARVLKAIGEEPDAHDLHPYLTDEERTRSLTEALALLNGVSNVNVKEV